MTNIKDKDGEIKTMRDIAYGIFKEHIDKPRQAVLQMITEHFEEMGHDVGHDNAASMYQTCRDRYREEEGKEPPNHHEAGLRSTAQDRNDTSDPRKLPMAAKDSNDKDAKRKK